MKIFILHRGKANYPEINAYSEYFRERGWEVASGSPEQYQRFPDAEKCVLWCIMGFYPKKLAARYLIHDYRSLSVGSHSALKDRLKRALHPRPNLRIFQNSSILEMMGFNDDVDTILLPMGVPDWIFSLDSNNNDALPSGTYCYVGEITRERGFVAFIADYLRARQPSETLVLVGTVEKEIFDLYGDKEGLIFTGRLPQRDALAVVGKCEYAISTIPYCRPYNVQTPTKLLEYAALGKRIICNDSPSNLMAIRELGIQCMVTGPQLFSGIRDLRNGSVPANNPSSLTHLRWGQVIAASGVERYLAGFPLNFQMHSRGANRERGAKILAKDSKQKTLFLMRDVRGGGAELVTLNIVSGIVARGGTARIHTFDGTRVDHEIPENLTKAGNSITGANGKALSLLAAARDSDVIVGSLEIKTHVAAVILGLLLHRPVVLWLHKDLSIFLPHKSVVRRVIYKTVFGLNMRLACAIVTVSEGVGKNLSLLFPESADKIVSLHNPVDFTRIEKSKDEGSGAPWMQYPFVLAVGRLTWQKGFDILIDAFAHVIPNNQKLNLVILGEGDERATLEKRVLDLGLHGRVFLPGFTNPYPAMRRASVIAMSSHFEGLPTVLIEALHIGAKIVSVDCPSGPSEVLLGGKLGRLVNGRSSEMLAQAIVSSLHTDDTADAKCLRALRAADFSFEHIVPKWESLLVSASKWN